MLHKIKKCAMCAMSVIASTVGFASNYYVDANYGNDDWDGTTATIPSQAVIDQGGTISGPRKTLHAMMSDARVVAGDTVWAAEGDYNEGGDVNGTAVTTNRVQVKGGVKLCASGARDATFISGANGIDGAYSNGAVRCVFFLPPAKSSDGYGIVKGFTVRNGRTCASNEFGGGATGAGLMVGCDFQNNGCQNKDRAGTINGGYALRCKFTSVNRAFQAYNESRIINSLLLTGTFYSKCRIVNCTFLGSSCPRNSSTYNCFFIGTGAADSMQCVSDNKSKHYNTYSRSAFKLNYCTTNETCRVVSAAETPYDETTFRPFAGSAAIDASNASHYRDTTNGWVAAWVAEADKDYYGNDRCVNGAIDVGCGEKQPVEGSPLAIVDELDGLVVTGANKGETQLVAGEDYNLTFSRTLTSDRLCLGVTVNGEFLSFGGTTSNVSHTVTLHGQEGQDNYIFAVYETDQKDWYVSPTGNDTNKGYHKNCPRKTLVEAMKLATANAGHVVHAAAGIYDSGEAWAGSCSNRVVVTKGVGLVADEWPLQETVIKGAADTTADADSNGNGPAAVRCAYVNSGGYVRGFKLTGGRTKKRIDSNDTSTYTQGGGAYLSSGALVDCEIASVGCTFRGPAAAGDSSSAVIRCNVHDIVSGSYNVYGGRIIDTYIVGGCYNCPVVLNSTLTGQMRANTHTIVANSYMQYAARAAFCTNCVFTRVADTAMSDGATYDPETCRFEVALASNLDENYRPSSPTSPLVDFGDKELYDKYFPAAWVQFKDKDFVGGQRIYNAQIDVGCGEYDFRGDFAGYLGTKVSIPAMGPNVTTNAARNIVVPEGETIDLAMPPKASGKSATYELVYTPAGGGQTVVHEASADGFTRTLEGACTVQSLSRVGFVFLIR